VVGRLVEFADNVYRRVEGLYHVRASRVRMEAERSMLLQGESADLEAQGDVRIQGDSVNLG